MLVPFPLPLTSEIRLRLRLRAVAVGVLVYGAVAPLVALAHELVVLATAALIGEVAWLAATGDTLRALPIDPIYTGAMLLTLGGIEPHGLAIAGWLGELLHQQWPALFQPPSLVAPYASASAILAPGSTILSRWVCGLAADAAQIALGLALIRLARGRWSWLAVVGAVVQARIVVARVIDVPPELVEVEAAGVPFALAMIVSGDVQAGPRLSETLNAMAEPMRNVVLGLGMVALAYLPILAAMLGWRLARVVSRRVRAGGSLRAPALAHLIGPAYPGSLVGGPGRVVALAIVALAVAISPLGDLSDARARFLSRSYDADTLAPDDPPILVDASPGTATGALASPPVASPAGSATSETIASSAVLTDSLTPAPGLPLATQPAATPGQDGPSLVAVTGSQYRYELTVNGESRVIRGMGYNVRYRRLPDAERARLLDRDFAALQQAGVTTVFGWEPTEFDDLLLDAAERHGLGVAPPFELDPDADYGDPAVRARLTTEVLTWVERYRRHPAVRMWAIGNEVLHKLVYPSWMPVRSDPAWEQRARSFAAFYVELIDTVHAADPNHPIVHRDAEDAYLTWLRDAMQPGGHRPWLIYGVNSYTPRLGEILANWPQQGWDTPLLVSEFAPGGMSPADRPDGLQAMWKTIRSSGGWVLGGAVYAWTTDGPEEIDRVFGLVDSSGQPVDGAFGMIGSLYRGAASRAQRDRVQVGGSRDERIWTYARHAIETIQAGRSGELVPPNLDGSVMGDIGAISQAPANEGEMQIQPVRDPRRVAWARQSGVSGEWWVTWTPPSTPNRKLTFIVQERQDGGLGVGYIYHGPR